MAQFRVQESTHSSRHGCGSWVSSEEDEEMDSIAEFRITVVCLSCWRLERRGFLLVWLRGWL